MDAPPFPVLYEDNHLLAVVKPPTLPTMGAAKGERSVVELSRAYIKSKYGKPGNVYLGVVSRLDALVSGVVLLARTSKAAARLTEQFRAGHVEKTYWAIVVGRPKPSQGRYVDAIVKDERRRRMCIARPDDPKAKQARLSYRPLARLKAGTLLEIVLETGRKHQIRLQLASRGHPLLGDRKYGSHAAFPVGIALHSRRLVLEHPVRKCRIELTAPLPKAWEPFGDWDELTADGRD